MLALTSSARMGGCVATVRPLRTVQGWPGMGRAAPLRREPSMAPDSQGGYRHVACIQVTEGYSTA